MMQTRLFVLCLVSCILCLSCQSNTDKTPVVGSLDTLGIALDTNMQKGFESSYEFHKTLVVSEKLVYDVVAYGGPVSGGEYAILRRGADNKADTVQKGKRSGAITDAFLADSNKNNRPEIYIVIQSPAGNTGKQIKKYEE